MKKKAKRANSGTGRDIRAIMRGNKGKDTKPELALRRHLREAGLIGYRIHPSNIVGKPDVAYTRWKVAVFVHGCFWHGCPLCAKERPKANAVFWSEKLDANVRRDAEVKERLESLGYVVVVVWEHELTAPEDVIIRIANLLRAAGRPSPSSTNR